MRSFLLGLTAGLLSMVSTASASAVEPPCDDPATPSERTACVEGWVGGGIPDHAALERIDRLTATDPTLTLEILDAMDAAHGPPPDARLRSETLDRRAAALSALSRHDEATSALQEAATHDDGITRIDWFDREGEIAWTAPLAPGDGRDERIARSLVAAGRADAARARLVRALSLGAGEQARELWEELGGGEIPGLDGVAGELVAAQWFPLLSDVNLKLIEGEPRRLFEDRVLILDFWAVWCAPCAEQLPALQSFYDAEQERGLDVLTVNMKDAPDEARRFAWALNVRLPIARYTPEMDEVFNIRALPTVIVVDRNRRVRGRWSNAQEETRQKIDKLVLELLDEVEPPSRASVATVLRGSGRLAMRWSRHLPGRIEGLALLPGNQTADATLVAALGRELVTVGPLGRFTERKPAARGVGRLAAGGADLVGYRRGGVRVVTVHRNGDAGRGWDAPAPVLDLRFPDTPVSGGAELMLATTSGLHRVDLRGKQLAGRPDLGSLRSVAFDGEAPVGLDSTGKLIWLDAGLETLRSDVAPSPAVWLVSSEGEHGGVGAATAGVTSSAVGRFLGGESFQLALAVEEQLVLLDIVSGEERFRARWPRIGLLAGGDLDGDGREELIVGSGRRLSVLEPGADPEQASP